MKERLVIKNFGPIREVDLELGKMTVLIGDQATGKTTIAKVLAMCRYFSYIVIKEATINQGLSEWGLTGFIKEDSRWEYLCEDYKLTCWARNVMPEGKEPRYIFIQDYISNSERFQRLVDDFMSFPSRIGDEFTYVPSSFYADRVKMVMKNPFFIPPERGLQSIFSLGKGTVNNISDTLFNQFAQIDYIARNFKEETEIKPLDLLYKNIEGQGYVKKKGTIEFHSLYFGASGHQSAIPIVLSVKKYNEIDNRSRTFIVEEPEISLFPKTQKQLIDFFVESINAYNNQFLLTTHSPYVLSALNNLIYADKLAQNDKLKAKINSIIKSDKWLNIEEVSVYFLENGVSKNLIDKEEGLISINELDSVSEIVNDEFDQLLAIDVEHENEMES